MRTATLSAAQACIVDVAGNLSLHAHMGDAVPAEITRAACALLCEVHAMIRECGHGLAPELEGKIETTIAAVVGCLTGLDDGAGGLDRAKVAGCAFSLADVSSMIAGMHCSAAAEESIAGGGPTPNPSMLKPGTVRAYARSKVDRVAGQIAKGRESKRGS